MGPYIASTIYTTMIRPINLYCYPVLLEISNTLNDKLESIQVRASRIITQPGHIQLQMDIEYYNSCAKTYDCARNRWNVETTLNRKRCVFFCILGSNSVALSGLIS